MTLCYLTVLRNYWSYNGIGRLMKERDNEGMACTAPHFGQIRQLRLENTPKFRWTHKSLHSYLNYEPLTVISVCQRMFRNRWR
jgi:hypothetical protein